MNHSHPTNPARRHPSWVADTPPPSLTSSSLQLPPQTKLLYRSWLTDGTIPPNYVPPPPIDVFSPPSPAASASAPGARAPVPTSFAASLYSSGPLPAAFADHAGRATPSPVPADLPGSEGLMAPPAGGARAGGPGAAIDLGGEGKIRIGALSGAGWRTERDVASGSDLY